MSRRFSTILVANRGEIACRVIRTAKAEGYRTVAVYSDADADALHVSMADEAVRIGPPQVSESYLNMERVLEAARATGAEAIHPGYGFLSENAEFAEVCAKAGIVFIGPPAKAIGRMGDKAEAKRLMIGAGVACVPGYEGEARDDATLKAESKKIGFPVLLKAAAGGGGRGMRRANSAKEMDEALAGARSEAKNAFGSDALILEKYVESARHVEIQVVADEHGRCIHLGERDCSVQRRHQKIIEESPCPAITSELREAMGAAAVEAAQAAGYVGAGTVEFLLDDAGHFYFLEMNTRLQVEHPVTEVVTGLDLVALQLSVAQGDALPIAQADVSFDGCAIEARLYAEDPAQDFLPQTGAVLAWEAPVGTGIRVDHGLEPGCVLSPYYDPMVAKVIAWGASREEARCRLLAALRRTLLLGVKSNAALLGRILEHESFASGEARTTFIDDSGVLEQTDGAPDLKRLLVAAAVLIEQSARAVPPSMKGWRSTGPVTVPFNLADGNEAYELTVAMTGSRYEVKRDDETAAIEVDGFGAGRISWNADGRHERAHYAVDGVDLYLSYAGSVDHFVDRTYAPPEASELQGDGVLKAPMAGQIVRMNVSEGDGVSKGDVLVVLEAMKIENHIVAPHDGKVEAISVAVGDQVDANQLLIKVVSGEGEAG